MARICELTGKRPMKGSIIWRSGKPKKQGGIGTHITAITKRRFLPNLQRVKAQLPNGEVRYIRVSASAIKKGLVAQGAQTDLEEARSGQGLIRRRNGAVLNRRYGPIKRPVQADIVIMRFHSSLKPVCAALAVLCGFPFCER